MTRCQQKKKLLNSEKSLGNNLTQNAQRERAMQFFHHPNVTKSLKRVDRSLNTFAGEEYSIKINLKMEMTDCVKDLLLKLKSQNSVFFRLRNTFVNQMRMKGKRGPPYISVYF